jgi:hypothetical protein
VINGKRYVWVIYSTGSNLGGHWEEEGLAPIRKVATISVDDMRMIQDRAFEGNILNRYKDHLYEYVGHRGY